MGVGAGIQARYPAEERGLPPPRCRSRPRPARIAPPPRSRVSAARSLGTASRDPGRAGARCAGWAASAPGHHSRATESPELSRSQDILSHAALQPRPEPRHPGPTHPGVVLRGARAASTPVLRGGPGEKEPAPEFWALRPARGAGWRARRCWPSLCGSARRPGLPLRVRSPLPRRKAERSGSGGDTGMRRGPGGQTSLGMVELESRKRPDTWCSFTDQGGN